MVTKLELQELPWQCRSVLAKIHMVTKRLDCMQMICDGSVLAKIHMVTKLVK